MKWLWLCFYGAAMRLYGLAIGVASLWNPKAGQWKAGRRQQRKTEQSTPVSSIPAAWFHCASAGELEQGRPLIEKFRSTFPGYRIVVTFFSPSGYEAGKKIEGADTVLYLPLDTAGNARQFIGWLNPSVAVFVKYELWYHMLEELRQRNIPMVLIAANFRRNQFLFSPLGRPLRKLLQQATRVFVQDETSLGLLQASGFSNAAVAGDTRFDRVWAISLRSPNLEAIERFRGMDLLFVAGSTWPDDERFLLSLIEKKAIGWKWILVPHEISTAPISRLRKASGAVLYSAFVKDHLPENATVMIVDAMGLLSSIYRYADMAYVGGGFGAGIHNTLEAAVYGLPVIFGPRYSKFREARELIATGGARSISDYDELESAWLYFQGAEGKENAGRNRDWVKQQCGATDRIMEYLKRLMQGNGV